MRFDRERYEVFLQMRGYVKVEDAEGEREQVGKRGNIVKAIEIGDYMEFS